MLPADDSRHALEQALLSYAARQPQCADVAARILSFIRSTPECFCRSHPDGHITGSAWLLSPGGDQVLLTLHRKLGRWLQPGGHADGDPDTLRVAIREAEEESGIAGITAQDSEIFDIDIHEIPARPQAGEPAHLHYDIRYLLHAPHCDFRLSDESVALNWYTPGELQAMLSEESILRMCRLWQDRCEGSAASDPLDKI